MAEAAWWQAPGTAGELGAESGGRRAKVCRGVWGEAAAGSRMNRCGGSVVELEYRLLQMAALWETFS